MWLIWLVEKLMLRCPVPSTVNGIQIESRIHLTPTFPPLQVGSWPYFSHGHHLWAGWSCAQLTDQRFFPAVSSLLQSPQASSCCLQHSILSSCSVVPSPTTKVWEIPLLVLSLEIVCCGVWWRPLTNIRLTNVGYCTMCWEKKIQGTRQNDARFLMLSLSRVQVPLRDCLITQGTVL